MHRFTVRFAPLANIEIETCKERTVMFKFLGKSVGIIFLIGLIVVIGLLMLIF